MKKFIKSFVNFLAIAIMAIACLSFTACADIEQLAVKIKVYNYTDSEYETYTLTVDLYRHLAQDTVDSIIENVNKGYYNNSIFYKMTSYSSQIMVGDIKADGDKLKFTEGKQVDGEFKSNGVYGSDLVNAKGYIGMWRSWTVAGNGFTASDMGRDSAVGTWFMPTGTLSSYDGYFAVFAKIDLSSEDNSDAFSALTTLFSSSTQYDQYEVYYVQENDKYVANYMLKTDFTENFDSETNMLTLSGGDAVKVVEAKNSDLVKYNHYTINVPEYILDGFGAVITSVKVL